MTMLTHLLSDKLETILTIQQADMKDLKRAKTLLEKPGISARILNLLGSSINVMFKIFPHKLNSRVGKLRRLL